ncbi:MAG: TIGR03000 domain-containing protein [Planctomycetes bacterium]|nr:TIGR03000 domain-containing protein [Planctomycetota bacterium]
MYSVVLLMALSGGADTPAFGFGCKSCNSYGCWSCSSSYSCGGWSCGCSYSCSGSCHKSKGCKGGWFSRKGCKGCHSSCHSCHDYHGCYGGCHGCHGGYVCGGACHGGYVCGGCAGACHGGCGAPVTPPPGKIPVDPKEKKTSVEPAPATIIVNLPAEAKLTVDDNPTTSTSDRRVFVSPALDRGTDYFYTLKAEVVRDGKTETRTEKVTVRAGEETKIEINFAAPTVAAK